MTRMKRAILGSGNRPRYDKATLSANAARTYSLDDACDGCLHFQGSDSVMDLFYRHPGVRTSQPSNAVK